MKKTITRISVMVIAMLMSLTAWADPYKVELLDQEAGVWSASTEWYEIATIADAFGISADEFISAYNGWKNAGYNSDFFQLYDENTETWSYSRGSAADGAFYIDADGIMQSGYSTATAYCRLDMDGDYVGITMGQCPLTAEGLNTHCIVGITINNTQLVFDVTLGIKVEELPEVEPVTTLADLTIVGHTTFKHSQAPDNTWYNEPNTIPTPGICEALGVDPAEFESKIKQFIFAKAWDSNTETWSTELTNSFTGSPSPGFWFGTGVYDEETQTESDELTWAEYGGTDQFFVVSIAYNSAEDAIDCAIGQYPNGMEVGHPKTADVYFVYGNKAYVVTIELTIEVEVDPITNYTKVGEQEFTVLRDPRNGWYVLEEFIINADSIAGLFTDTGTEITADDLVLCGIDQYGSVSTEYTADAPGFWFDANSVVKDSADGCLFVDYVAPDTLYLGNKPAAFSGGESIPLHFYFVVDKYYYEFIINTTIMEPPYKFEDCEEISYDLNVDLVPSASAWEIGKTDMAEIETLLGTSDGIFYGLDEGGNVTTAYSVTEATTYGGGGFWMSPIDPENNNYAYSAGYSGTGAFAAWYYDSYITWFAVPGFQSAGDYATAVFYIADFWSGKKVKLNVKLNFVEQQLDIKVAGSEDVIVPARNEAGDDFAETPLSLEACLDALGCTAEEFIEGGSWLVENSAKALDNTPFDDMYGFSLDADGHLTEDAEATVLQVAYIDETIHSFVIDDINVENTYKVVLYAMYNNKYYAFNVLINPQLYVDEDVNQDGSVNSLDVLKIYKFMQTSTGDAEGVIEDVNKDGDVNSLDVLKVYKYMQAH